jgi:hypothetical protein
VQTGLWEVRDACEDVGEGAEQELLKIVRRHYQPKTATADWTMMPPQRVRRS